MNGKFVLSGGFTEFELQNRSNRYYPSILYSKYSKYLRNITRVSKIKKCG